jgi:UDP-2,4-diacetamido-2,4,6-trideoxy-beta-L-altropyranose hydrolase
MQVVFRADASLEIGTGHVMRCLSLADGLRAQGARCTFLCREHPGHLLDLIRDLGFETIGLPSASLGTAGTGDGRGYQQWLGTTWAVDAQQTLAALPGQVDWLVVDHYGLDASWEQALRRSCQRILVIDDLADRPHDGDLLLDQNLGRSTQHYAGLIPARCRLLIGPSHALLRPEFAALRPQSLAERASRSPRHFLVSMGGVDKDNLTGRILQGLEHCALPADAQVTAVLGPKAPWVAEVRRQAENLRWRTHVVVNPQSMAEVLSGCDVAIGAAGTSALERCALGVPSIVCVMADNQQPGATALEARGAILLVDSKSPPETDLPLKTLTLLAGDALRKMQSASSSVTDGLGVSRVAKELCDETAR